MSVPYKHFSKCTIPWRLAHTMLMWVRKLSEFPLELGPSIEPREHETGVC